MSASSTIRNLREVNLDTVDFVVKRLRREGLSDDQVVEVLRQELSDGHLRTIGSISKSVDADLPARGAAVADITAPGSVRLAISEAITKQRRARSERLAFLTKSSLPGAVAGREREDRLNVRKSSASIERQREGAKASQTARAETLKKVRANTIHRGLGGAA